MQFQELTSEFTFSKTLVILFMLIGLAGLGFYAFNIPEFTNMILPYWLLYLTGFVFIALGLLLKTFKKNIPFPGPVVFEKPFFDLGRLNVVYVTVPIIFGLLLFATISTKTTGQLLAGPTFQVIPLTSSVSGIAKFFAANAEDVFFSGFLTPAIFGVTFLLLRKTTGEQAAAIIAALLTLLLSPAIFTLYHFSRYGFTDIVSSTNVFIMSVLFTGWVLLARNLVGPFAMHAGNNLGIFAYEAGLGAWASIFGWLGALILIAITVFVVTKPAAMPRLSA